MNHKLGKHQRAVISPIVDMSPRENVDCIITAECVLSRRLKVLTSV